MYKDVAGPPSGRPSLLRGPWSDVLAAVLIGVVTFSKPPHVLLLAPLAAMAISRGQWRRAALASVIAGSVAASLFVANAAITGEFNYQGGYRQTFYSHTGFPFANSWETFDNIGPVRGREDLMVGDVLVNSHSLTVFRHNVVYLLIGRNSGLVPYFFPGMLAFALLLISKDRRPWQWLFVVTIVAAILMHLFVWPFTFNGAGGPVGSRYFLPFYSLFLFLLPSTAGIGTALVSLTGGALFTATILLNPFYASSHPGEHAKSGPLRWLPIELTLINDLPVAQNPDRMKQPLGGDPPVLAYFSDDNAFTPEPALDQSFWVKGKSETEVVLRAPVADGGGKWISKAISRLNLDVRNGGVTNRVTVSTGRERRTLEMSPGELQHVSLTVRAGVPYRRDIQPTSYLYTLTIRTTNGFVPFLDLPCERPGSCASSDPRFLGALIHVVPEYTDADVSTGSAPGAAGAGKGDIGGVRDIP